MIGLLNNDVRLSSVVDYFMCNQWRLWLGDKDDYRALKKISYWN